MPIAKITGYLLQVTGTSLVVFVIAGSMHLFALGICQILVPKMEPVVFGAGTAGQGSSEGFP